MAGEANSQHPMNAIECECGCKKESDVYIIHKSSKSAQQLTMQLKNNKWKQ